MEAILGDKQTLLGKILNVYMVLCIHFCDNYLLLATHDEFEVPILMLWSEFA